MRLEKVSTKCCLHKKPQKCKVFQDLSICEKIPTLERSQESDSMCKGIKNHITYNLVEMEFSSNR